MLPPYGVVGDAKGARSDHGGAGAGEAGDAVDAGGLTGFGQGQRRQGGGEPPGPHRRARPGGPRVARYGQNARITFSFTSASRDADGYPVWPTF